MQHLIQLFHNTLELSAIRNPTLDLTKMRLKEIKKTGTYTWWMRG